MHKQLHLVLLGISIAFSSLAQLPEAAEIKKLKIKKITRQQQGNTTASGSAVWYYNANGDDTAYYSYGKRSNYKTYEYDAKQRITMIKEYSDAGKNTEKTSFIYNTDGSFVTTNTDTQYGMTNTEEFDKKGNLIKKTIPDGSVHHYEYNSKGQLVKAYSTPNSGGMEFTNIYTYNNTGKQIKILKTGDYPSTSTYEYDAKGLLKKSTVKGESDDEKTVYLYSYSY